MSLLIFCVWGVDFPDRMFPYCLIQSSDLWDGLRYNRAPLGGPVDSTGCVQSELLNLFANNLKKTGILTEQKWNHFIHKSKNKDQIVSLINTYVGITRFISDAYQYALFQVVWRNNNCIELDTIVCSSSLWSTSN